MDRPRRQRSVTSPYASPPLSPTLSTSSLSRTSTSIPRLLASQQLSQRRLLVPTSWPKPTIDNDARPVKSKASTHKLSRSRADSTSQELPPEPKDDRRWLDTTSRFQAVEENVKLSGYQIFAVEKWIVERTRAITLLTVYTGDPKDTINVTALAPLSSLSAQEAQKEWEKAIHDLRKDGARPRETDKGVIMVTSLANFRSDYTVVCIPDGDFLAYREKLYVNINLLRMGCSGRSALTLQEPSDTTKDRFISLYHFTDTIKTENRFNQTVLELVKLFQCALSLFDLFPVDSKERDGLLCDTMVNSIQNWISQVGEPYMKVEPTERVADPSTVASIISLCISMRNKLSAIGYQNVPKDPFMHPRRFTRVLAAFVNQRLIPSPTSASTSGLTQCQHAYLNLALIKHIDAAYEKYRSSDAYKLHRAVLNTIDDLTSATTQAMSSSKGVRHGQSMSLSLSSKEREAESLLEGTPDLASFVNKVGYLRGKDCGSSVRYLWTGKLDQLDRKRKESIWSDIEEDREREKEMSASDEENDSTSVFPWSNRVTKKLENWAGREFGKSRSKKTSLELQHNKDKSPDSLQNASTVPSVVVSREFEEALSGLSSGQVSPISPATSMHNFGFYTPANNSSLWADDDFFESRLPGSARYWVVRTYRRKRALSWADSKSVYDVVDQLDSDTLESTERHHEKLYKSLPGFQVPGGFNKYRYREERRPLRFRKKRSHSLDDRDFYDSGDVLTPDRMRIDVDLCAQCLVMQRRKIHIKTAVTALQAMVQCSSTTNELLLKYHEDRIALLKELASQSQMVTDIEKAVSDADAASADTDALMYEVDFLDIPGLWRMARGPRLRVFAIRDKVFGVRGRRRYTTRDSNIGTEGGHGRFNRLQRRPDGTERYVDFLGRTESDVEEESELPELTHIENSSDSEDEGEHIVDMSDRGDDEGRESRLHAISNYLLALFTDWGRLLGVGGHATIKPDSASPGSNDREGEIEKKSPDTESHGEPLVNVSLDDQKMELSKSMRRLSYIVNGHYHRLSTVGEEDEPDSLPPTPSSQPYKLSPTY